MLAAIRRAFRATSRRQSSSGLMLANASRLSLAFGLPTPARAVLMVERTNPRIRATIPSCKCWSGRTRDEGNKDEPEKVSLHDVLPYAEPPTTIILYFS